MDDEKINKNWQRLSAFIISQSINEMKGKIRLFIGQAKKNSKKANKKEKTKKVDKTEKIEKNIIKLTSLIDNYETLEQKLNKSPNEINPKEVERMAHCWSILRLINDWKDFAELKIEDNLKDDIMFSLVNKEYIYHLHAMVWIKLKILNY